MEIKHLCEIFLTWEDKREAFEYEGAEISGSDSYRNTTHPPYQHEPNVIIQLENHWAAGGMEKSNLASKSNLSI